MAFFVVMYHFVPMLIYIVLASLPFYALVLWLGVQLVIEGELTVGQLIAFNMLSGQVDQSIIRPAQRWQDFQSLHIKAGEVIGIVGRWGSLSCLTVQPIALRMGGVGLCWAGADVATFRRYHR